jgi:hypothetical protein
MSIIGYFNKVHIGITNSPRFTHLVSVKKVNWSLGSLVPVLVQSETRCKSILNFLNSENKLAEQAYVVSGTIRSTGWAHALNFIFYRFLLFLTPANSQKESSRETSYNFLSFHLPKPRNVPISLVIIFVLRHFSRGNKITILFTMPPSSYLVLLIVTFLWQPTRILAVVQCFKDIGLDIWTSSFTFGTLRLHGGTKSR